MTLLMTGNDTKNSALIESKSFAVIELSREWFASLDRSSIGSFAADSESLIIRHADEVASFRGSGYDADYNAMHKVFGRLKKEHCAAIGIDNTIWADLSAEMFFWMKVQGVEGVAKTIFHNTGHVKRKFEFLDFVHSYNHRFPGSLPLIEGGLLDKSLIRYYVDRMNEHDIPADLMLRMIAEGNAF